MTSKSPNRGRPLDKRADRSLRTTSGIFAERRIHDMAYTSDCHHSLSRKQSVERQFHRPLTPETRRFYNEKVFYPSRKPDRFKDVFSSNRCPRCYSSKHIGKLCPVYTKLYPRICSHCRYLYPPTQDCKYSYGRSRPITVI